MNKYEATKILNLPTTYSLRELKTAHRNLAFQRHPDRGGDRLRFIEIQEAYELLSATTITDGSISEEDKIDGIVVSVGVLATRGGHAMTIYYHTEEH